MKKPKSISKLPKYVSKDRSRYVYKAYLGRVNGRIKWGKPIRLCGLDAPMSEVWQAYERIVGQSPDTLKWLLKKYSESEQFALLTPVTQQGYEGYRRVICNRPTRDGRSFGDVALKDVTKRTLRKYLDSYEAKTTGNRHIQYIKAAWNWGAQRFGSVPEVNPAIGVSLNKEVARDRYITDDEYKAVYECAESMRVPIFGPAMELAYLCRARRSEVFGFTLEDVREEGLLLRRGKGSMDEITLWTPRLRAAVEACKSIYPKAPRPIKGAHLLHDRNGKPYTKNALDSAWQRVMKKANLAEPFTYHDIKAKGVSDSDMQNAGMHKSKKMEAVYDRLPKKITLDYGS